MNSYTLIVFSISALAYLSLMILMSKNLIDNKNSDAFLQLNAAEKFGEWILPSKMHEFANGKSYMKDMGLLFLVFVIKVLRFPHKFSAIVQVCILSHVISAILIYFISVELFSYDLGLIGFLLYLCCGWAYQIILMGGYQLVAQMVFLFLFYFALVLPNLVGLGVSALVSGVIFGSLVFSSASARKYYISAVGVFLYAYIRNKGIENADFLTSFVIKNNYPKILIIFVVVSFFHLILVLVRKKVIEFKEKEKTIPFINKTFNKSYTTKYYLDIYRSCSGALKQFFYLFLPVWSLAILAGGSEYTYYSLSFFVGVGVSVLFFSYPNFFKIVREGFGYLSNVDAGHFMLYKEYLEKVDGKVRSGWRANKSGVLWIVKITFQYVPVQALLLILLGVAVVYFNGLKVEYFLLLFLVLSPHVWGELTSGPQIGRSYFPGYTGLLFGVIIFSGLLPEYVKNSILPFLFFACVLSFVQCVRIVLFDIYKNKMWVSNLKRELDRLGIKKFSTYKSAYNHSFVDVLEIEFPGEFEIDYTDKIKNSKFEYFVIPCTSSKAAHMESENEALQNGDFDHDEVLENLLNSGKIEKLSVSRINTLGNSRFWIHESEVTSYRYLMLGQYDKDHFRRAFAWVVEKNKVMLI